MNYLLLTSKVHESVIRQDWDIQTGTKPSTLVYGSISPCKMIWWGTLYAAWSSTTPESAGPEEILVIEGDLIPSGCLRSWTEKNYYGENSGIYIVMVENCGPGDGWKCVGDQLLTTGYCAHWYEGGRIEQQSVWFTTWAVDNGPSKITIMALAEKLG